MNVKEVNSAVLKSLICTCQDYEVIFEDPELDPSSCTCGPSSNAISEVSDVEITKNAKKLGLRSLNSSEKKKKRKKEYICTICDFIADSIGSFFNHLNIHSAARAPYKCTYCMRVFESQFEWRQDLSNHMNVASFGCHICELEFTTKALLTRHNKYKHSKEKTFECEICDYKAVEYAKIKRHEMIHRGEKPYKCPHCVYSASEYSKIKRHLVVHTKEKPYPCEVCESSFSQPGSLKIHYSHIHGIKKMEFICPYCEDFKSLNMKYLKDHVKVVHLKSKFPLMVVPVREPPQINIKKK